MTNENWQSRGYFSEDLCPSELRGSPFGEVKIKPGRINMNENIIKTAYKKNGFLGSVIIVWLACAAFIILAALLGLIAGGVI